MGNLFRCGGSECAYEYVKTLNSSDRYTTSKECIVIATEIDSATGNAESGARIRVTEGGNAAVMGVTSMLDSRYKDTSTMSVCVATKVWKCIPTSSSMTITSSADRALILEKVTA